VFEIFIFLYYIMSTAIIAGVAAGGAALLLIGIGSLFMGSSDVEPRARSGYRRTGSWDSHGSEARGVKKQKKGSTKRRKSSGKGTKKK